MLYFVSILLGFVAFLILQPNAEGCNPAPDKEKNVTNAINQIREKIAKLDSLTTAKDSLDQNYDQIQYVYGSLKDQISKAKIDIISGQGNLAKNYDVQQLKYFLERDREQSERILCLAGRDLAEKLDITCPRP